MAIAFTLISGRYESLVPPGQLALAAVVAFTIGMTLHLYRKKAKGAPGSTYTSLLFLRSGVALFVLAVIFDIVQSGGPME